VRVGSDGIVAANLRGARRMAVNFAKLPELLERSGRTTARRRPRAAPAEAARASGGLAAKHTAYIGEAASRPSYCFPVTSRPLTGEATPSSNAALTGTF
jgi:hypothetical protein